MSLMKTVGNTVAGVCYLADDVVTLARDSVKLIQTEVDLLALRQEVRQEEIKFDLNLIKSEQSNKLAALTSS